MLRDTPVITIGGRRVAEDVPLFAMAEIGINHGGSLDRALALVDAAASAGAHAVKLQTIVARELVAPGCPAPAHVSAPSLVDFFERFELDETAHRRIADRTRDHGMKVVATPFSIGAVDLLERIEVDAYKIASGDLTWDQLIIRAAATGRPLVISTGMATLAEVHHALAVARAGGARQVALLQCVSAYPVPRGSENLLAIRSLLRQCRVPVGLSDHGEDTFALPMAVALGASIYERHLVLEGDTDAVDREVSSTPAEFAAAVDAARRAWAALGSGRKACLSVEAPNLVASRRSLCARRPLPAGATITPDDLVALRPATGVAPANLSWVSGRRLVRPLAQGEPVRTRDLEPARSSDRAFEPQGLSETDRVA